MHASEHYTGMQAILISMQWLLEDFMVYFTKWQESVKKRIGFSKTSQNKMLLSASTRLGMYITCEFYNLFLSCISY